MTWNLSPQSPLLAIVVPQTVCFPFKIMSSQVGTTKWLTKCFFIRMTNCPSFPGPEGVHGLQDVPFENWDNPWETRRSWSLDYLFKYLFSVTETVTLIHHPGIIEKQREPYAQPQPATLLTNACFPHFVDQALLLNTWPEGRIQSETQWARPLHTVWLGFLVGRFEFKIQICNL